MVEENNLSATVDVFSPVVSEKVKYAYSARRRNVVISLPDACQEPYSEAIEGEQALGYSLRVGTKVLATGQHPQSSFWGLIAFYTSKIWNWIIRRIK